MRRRAPWSAAVLALSVTPAGAASYIYVVGGGSSGGGYADVYYSQVLSGGALAGWVSTQPYPTPIREHWLVVENGMIYAFGGVSGVSTTVDWVHSAQTSPAGIVGGWNSTTPLPSVTYNGVTGADPSNGFVYTLGGSGATTWAASFGGGSVGSWGSQSPLPISPSEHAGCTAGGYAFVYYYSGSAGFWSAPIGGGSLSSWSSELAPPVSVVAAQMASWGNDLYFIGGCFGSSQAVYGATQAGGTIPSWNSVTPLPLVNCEQAVCIVDGYLFCIGGYTGSAPLSDVYSAQVFAGGGLGSWQSVAPLPIAVWEPQAAPVCFNGQGTPGPCAPGTPSNTSTRTATRTQTPSRTPTPNATAQPTPTCELPAGSATPPYLLVNRNVFDPEREMLQIVWAVVDPDAVQVAVFDSAGEFIRNLHLQSCSAGTLYRALWDGKNYQDRTVTSGVYILRLVTLGAKQAIQRRVAVLRGTR